jgi:hypothetical protein
VSNTIYNFFKYKLIFFKGGAPPNNEDHFGFVSDDDYDDSDDDFDDS